MNTELRNEKSQLEDRNAFWVLESGKGGLRASEEEGALVVQQFVVGKSGWCRFCCFVERTRIELLITFY